jgi:hypothetical protein
MLLELLKNWKFWLVVAVIGGFLVYKPEVVGNAAFTQQVNGLKTQINQKKPQNLSQLKTITDKAGEQVLGIYSQTKKDRRIPGLPQEIVVNQAVDDLTRQIKNIPAEQLKVVKREFCRDVIDEATGSAR